MVFQYSIKDIKVFVDGREIEGLIEIGISPKGDQDAVKPIKDWSGKTIGYSIKDDTDCEGSITIQASSKNVPQLIQLAASKKQVQIVIAAENRDALNFSKITADDCIFFYPEFKPSAEEANAEFRFIGTNFRIE
ncbi:hypothetical protein [Geoglobus acetivorans]|uniref:Uncharacterized protein n=1 Tax=Geoglobus acetivorans TaxID=565033 RepID=A0A0A7GCV3_GEOAI|nr:hypothetical protein GACE_0841 [Geoglobus acetivorans]